ncbi:putative secretory lipase [Umbelopsis sp. AD052]|nr:putative secretory lipase [Umbelopsis sp. AD052]
MPAIVLGRVVTTFVWVGLWLSSIATPTLAVPVRRAAVLPQDDPFYTPPAGYESSAPGEILRTRPVPNKLAAFSAFPQNIANAWQILYRTTDALGNPQATVTTVMEPHNPDTTKLLSYQVAEDSAYQGCAPSYVLQAGTGLSDTASQAELLLMDAALDRGWYVSTPDYEGPNSAFTAGIQAGHATLDSIRAVLKSTNVTNVSGNATVAMWGYSGGALASGWAAELQPTYAPELKIAGAAIGGTPGDLNATLYAVNKGLFVGLVPAGIVGLCQQYPELNEYVIANLKADKKDAFFKANSQCLDADTSQYAFQDMFSYFTNYNVLQGDVAVKILNENKMGKYIPKIPLHMYHSANDEMVPFAPTQALVKQYCSQGVNIEFVKDELSEHIILAITGAADALIWLNDRFNGVPVKQGCSSRTTLTSALDSGALVVFGKVIFNLLGDLLGKPIGPNSIAR